MKKLVMSELTSDLMLKQRDDLDFYKKKFIEFGFVNTCDFYLIYETILNEIVSLHQKILYSTSIFTEENLNSVVEVSIKIENLEKLVEELNINPISNPYVKFKELKKLLLMFLDGHNDSVRDCVYTFVFKKLVSKFKTVKEISKYLMSLEDKSNINIFCEVKVYSIQDFADYLSKLDFKTNIVGSVDKKYDCSKNGVLIESNGSISDLLEVASRKLGYGFKLIDSMVIFTAKTPKILITGSGKNIEIGKNLAHKLFESKSL